jgi:hypothetical protein
LVPYVGDSTGTTGAPQKLNQKIIMVEKHFKQSTISPQTNTIDNSPTMRAMCSWWEKEEGAKVPKD